MVIGIPTPNSLVAGRFWEKVDRCGPDDCWEWLGAKDRRSGYGRVSDGEAVVYAHRLSWMLAFGAIPKFIGRRKAMVRHLCGNSSCVNPGHLAIGNGSDNNNDCHEMGRRVRFTLEEIKIVRGLKLSGMSNIDMARKFKVCCGTIDNVLKGKGIYSKYLYLKDIESGCGN